jgi:hypothetical protein
MKIVAQTSFNWGTIRLKKSATETIGVTLFTATAFAVSEVERFPQNISAYG